MDEVGHGEEGVGKRVRRRMRGGGRQRGRGEWPCGADKKRLGVSNSLPFFFWHDSLLPKVLLVV